MKKVAIVVGHWPTSIDGGAYNENLDVSEFDFNNPLGALVCGKLREHNILPMLMYRETYENLPAQINETGADVCAELHCNAHNNQTAGAEVLYHYNSTNGKKLAECIQPKIVSIMGENDRGVKPRKNGDDGYHLLNGTSMPAVIVESLFIDNDESLTRGLERREALAEAIALGIADYLA
ncbi:hypothetical protein C1S86_24340 [Vibrio parahaemolyticus]|uniref:N-acetylmuramoyl-L-alanine amidase family protein n=1 Tax=Vibrio parahaemolyticus TaxID=670 RepID=UPI000C876CA9|nr:N-acetylmuramoyl-L-alanine amidase [Vibrio parahaemolyticus]PMT73886.1 hypothetical protein C1S97_25260 [Vibrio parahaemolyticus]PMT79086.1 hypothetical protein C1S86_24340 [Vibrio parahaemolyticus]